MSDIIRCRHGKSWDDCPACQISDIANDEPLDEYGDDPACECCGMSPCDEECIVRIIEVEQS